MSRLLIIEPHKMLQQALLLALVPEHQVRIAAALPTDAAPGEFDLVIVDAAALIETAAPAAQTLATVLGWQVPTVLIEAGAQGAQIAARAPLVRLQAPIGKDSLRSALAECLRQASAATADSATRLAEDGKKPAPKPFIKQRRSKDRALTTQETSGLIELVDVIEEDETEVMEKK